MAEYIKRTDVMKICEGYSTHCFNSNDSKGQDVADRILDDVVAIPTADVVELKRGEWELSKYVYGTGMIVLPLEYKCSLCGKGAPLKMNYCPECGAKMDGGEIHNG